MIEVEPGIYEDCGIGIASKKNATNVWDEIHTL